MNKTESKEPLLTHSEMVALAGDIEQKTAKLTTLLKSCHLIHGSVAVLPRHSVDEQGHDSVFDSVTSIDIKRLEGTAALNHALDSLKFHERHRDFSATSPNPIESLSQVAARRSAGIIHLSPINAIQGSSIRDLVDKINLMKTTLKLHLTANYPKSYDRKTKFYNAHFPHYMPKSITRLIRIAPENTTRIHFSWLNKGYTMESLNKEQVLSYIDKSNRRKLDTNPDLGMDLQTLIEMDTAKLADYEHFYRLLPARLHPLQRVTVNENGTPKQLPSQRAVVPMIVLQKPSLQTYGYLSSLNSLDELRKCINKKLVEHRVVIEEYKLYAGRLHEDTSSINS